jgi:methylmalonyl-CoA mutase, N-terminal domain
VPAIERGYPQKEIAESAYRFQQAVEQRDRIIVGVNAFVEEQEEAVGILYIDESVAQRQLARLEQVKETRDNDQVRSSLERLQAVAQAGENTMPLLLDAVRAYATIGEMCDALREVWGEYEETPVI